ncbi:MAG: FidL-like protein [Enterobacterales bacterium]|uniref:FidL-like protein n=1 Tax=Serratia sp. (in: enterobacteria) TaxID=616 RepID=UPI003F419306
MKVKYFLTSIVIILLLGYACIITFFNKKSILCDSEQIITISNSKEEAKLDALYSLIFNHDNTGLLRAVGAVSINGEYYGLNRVLHFNYVKERSGKMYKFTITEEKINRADTLSTELFHTYFLPEKPGDSFFAGIKNLNENAIFVRGLTYPYFICKTH